MPVQQSERDRTSIDLPVVLDKAWALVSSHYGLQCAGNVTSTFLANVVYDNNGDIQRARFRWNHRADVVASENNFITMFVGLEHTAQHLYKAQYDFMSSPSVTTMTSVRDAFKAVFGSFRHSFINSKIDSTTWVDYIQSIHGWGLNGRGGASGSQALCVQSMDAMLGVGGNSTSLMYDAQLDGRTGCTRAMQQYIAALESDVEGRFANPDIRLLRDECVRQLVIFRTVHATRAHHYLQTGNSKRTSGGTIDVHVAAESSIADTFKTHAAERVSECADSAYWDQRMFTPKVLLSPHSLAAAQQLGNKMLQTLKRWSFNQPDSISG